MIPNSISLLVEVYEAASEVVAEQPLDEELRLQHGGFISAMERLSEAIGDIDRLGQKEQEVEGW